MLLDVPDITCSLSVHFWTFKALRSLHSNHLMEGANFVHHAGSRHALNCFTVGQSQTDKLTHKHYHLVCVPKQGICSRVVQTYMGKAIFLLHMLCHKAALFHFTTCTRLCVEKIEEIWVCLEVFDTFCGNHKKCASDALMATLWIKISTHEHQAPSF